MAYEHTGRKFDPQSSNKYPDDGRQFVLHTSTGPVEVCAAGSELRGIIYPNGTDKRPVLSDLRYALSNYFLWSHVAV